MIKEVCFSLLSLSQNSTNPPPQHLQKLIINNFITQAKNRYPELSMQEKSPYCNNPLYYRWNDSEIEFLDKDDQNQSIATVEYNDILEGKQIDLSFIESVQYQKVEALAFQQKEKRSYKKYIPWVVGALVAGGVAFLVTQQTNHDASSNRAR